MHAFSLSHVPVLQSLPLIPSKLSPDSIQGTRQVTKKMRWTRCQEELIK